VTLCYANTLPTVLTVNSASGTYGGSVNLSATLTDGASPLSGRTINFALKGTNVGTGVTDASGVATLVNASLSGINANSYPTGVSVGFTGDATFLASSATNTLTVNKADANIVVTSYNVPFDGNSHTTTGTATGVSNESLNGLDLSATTHTNAANYSGDHWTFTDVTGNYNNASGTVDDAISEVSSATKVTVGNATYDGSPHGGTASVTGTGGLNQSLTVTYSGRNTTVYGPNMTAPANAGDYTATATYPGDANHTSSNDSKDYSIFTAGSATQASVSDATYDGNPHGGSAAVTGAGGLSQSVTVSYSGRNGTVYGPGSAPPVNAGDYTVTASYAGDPNHSGSSDARDYSILKASSNTQASASDTTYDGSPHGGSASVTGAGGLSQSVTVSYSGRNSTVYGPSAAAPANAGDYTARAAYGGDANHSGSNDSKDYSILKASSVTQASASDIIYDGNAHGGSASVTGVGGLNQPLTVTYSGRNTTVFGPATTPPANAGDYIASASYPGDDNHSGSNDSKDYSILKASSVTQASVSNAGYDGSPHGGSASVTGAGGLNQSLTVTYSGRNTTVYGPAATPPANAGDYTASASYAGDANHSSSNDSKGYSISKASSTTTVICPATVIATGSPLTPCTAGATGAGGLNDGLPVEYTNNVNVGTAMASASYAGDQNHLPSAGSVTFVITGLTGSTFNFVIGDNNAVVGNQVTFWGAKWAKSNSLSGGPAPASFKGFANATSTQPATCGGTWTSDPGASSGPPATIPEYITVIVSSSISRNGSVISGNNRKLVIVKTNPGYGSDPGQAGTGTVVSIVCP
jgi:hypothetical protein